MARKGGNKKSCDKYKTSGHYEENKRRKQEKIAKKLAKFAKRREEGTAYKYDKEKTNAKIIKELGLREDIKPEKLQKIKENDPRVKAMFAPNRDSKRAKHTPCSRRKSWFAKLDNILASKEEALKRLEAIKKAKEVSA